MNETNKDAAEIKRRLDSSFRTFGVAGIILIIKNIIDAVLIYGDGFDYDPFVRHGTNLAIVLAAAISFSNILKNKRDLDYVKEDSIDTAINDTKDCAIKEFDYVVNETGEAKEYIVSINRLSLNGKDRSLINCVIKISDDITFSYKNESNNSVVKSGSEIFPCYGLGRVTSEFRSSKGSNGLYEYIFGFKLWHDTNRDNIGSENMCTYWTPSFMYSINHPEGIEDMIYRIQKDIQEAINKANNRTGGSY